MTFSPIMTSRTERFERKAKEVPKSGTKPDEEEEEIIRFSPEEEDVRFVSLWGCGTSYQADVKLI
jgi:hypothetical protein